MIKLNKNWCVNYCLLADIINIIVMRVFEACLNST